MTSSIEISIAVFVCVFAGALLGMLLRKVLPQEHLSDDSSRMVLMATGLVVTMSALVLGMLVSSSKAAYDARKNDLTQVCSKVVMLDRVLANYGPEAAESRSQLRNSMETILHRIWPEKSAQPARLTPSKDIETIYEKVLALSPQTDAQGLKKAEAVRMATELTETRWLLVVESGTDSVSLPLLLIVVSWLTAVFISFGLFAPANWTVIVTLVVCALAVSAAIFIIVEMNAPFQGVLRLSGAPVRAALEQLGK